MIAVSSFRPWTDPDGEYAVNQTAAFKSWKQHFETIVYLNDPQLELVSEKTVFMNSEPFPRIVDLAEVCVHHSGWSAIINADIVIGPNFPLAYSKLKSKKGCAAASWRYEFDPAFGITDARVVDNGLDFFAATQEIWQLVYLKCPEELRLGSQCWDTWMLSFFATFAMHGFFDITPSRVVHHPKHGSRCYGPPVDPSTIRIWSVPIMPNARI